jgi:hypothetical protein
MLSESEKFNLMIFNPPYSLDTFKTALFFVFRGKKEAFESFLSKFFEETNIFLLRMTFGFREWLTLKHCHFVPWILASQGLMNL